MEGLFAVEKVFAHVGYVVGEKEVEKLEGFDLDYLLSALRDPVNIALIVGTIFVVLLLYKFIPKIKCCQKEFRAINKKCNTYIELVPWMLRLSVGIALIGSGVHESLFSPIIPNMPEFSVLQILLGFLLLSGLLIGPVLWVVIALFAYGLYIDPYLIGSLEILAAALAVLMFASSRPGIDDVFNAPFFLSLKRFKPYVPIVLRVGLGVSMMFLGFYEKFLNPHISALVVSDYGLDQIVPVSPEMWVLSAGLIEFVLGLFIVLGFHARLVAAVTFVVLSLSFFYFGEAVYSHITIFGVLSVIFVFGKSNVIPKYDSPECMS